LYNIFKVNNQYEIKKAARDDSFLEPVEGFEPTTPRLQITCSGQLSYTGDFAGAKLQLFFEFARRK
jgi:hypothetical protein